MMSNIYNYSDLREFTEDAAQAIEDFVFWKLTEQETVSIALSGGTSPQTIYQKLAKNRKIDWSKIELFMVDERYVSPDDARSNFKMIEELLLRHLPPVKGFFAFNTHLPLEEAADQYDDLLEKRQGKCFDLVILGMGTDGHTASLFPGTEALNEKIKLATISHSPDGLARLTLTFPALFSAEKIIFLIQGIEKKELVKQLAQDPQKVADKARQKDIFPAQRMMRHPHVEIYYYDPHDVKKNA